MTLSRLAYTIWVDSHTKKSFGYVSKFEVIFYNNKTRNWSLIPGINKVFERQVWRVQVAHLHKAARKSEFFKFYPSVLLSTIKTSQSAREKLDSYCKKQIDVSFLCVCSLIEDKFRHNIVKVCCGTTRFHSHFDNVMTQFIFDKRTDSWDRRIKLLNWNC